MPSKKSQFHRGFFDSQKTVNREITNKSRYIYEKMIPKGPKGSGKYRKLLVPHGRLREFQDAILKYLTSADPVTKRYALSLFACHTAFKRGSSALKNAQAHVGYKVSLKFDLKDFFDSVPATPRKASTVYSRVRGMFNLNGKGQAARVKLAKQLQKVRIANVTSALITAGIPADIAARIADAASFRGFLYQGSPLSPMLANMVTKMVLCPRMLKLASVYDLPVFKLGINDGYVIFNLHGPQVWFTRLTKRGRLLLAGIKAVLDEKVRKSSSTALKVASDREKLVITPREFVHINCRHGETLNELLMRYGLLAWCRGVSQRVAHIRNVLLNKPRCVSIEGKLLFSVLRYRDINIWRPAKTVFTIYADDGVFSSNNPNLFKMKFILKKVINSCGFTVNMRKGIRRMTKRRFITGYEVSTPPPEAKDFGARLTRKTIDVKYRRELHHIKYGLKALDLHAVMRYNGYLAHLKNSNPNSWNIIAKKFYDLVMTKLPTIQEPDRTNIQAQVERYSKL